MHVFMFSQYKHYVLNLFHSYFPFTLPLQFIYGLFVPLQEKPEARHAQKKLAEKVTLLVHGCK